MAEGETYPVELKTSDGLVRDGGLLTFTDDGNQPVPPDEGDTFAPLASPTFTGTVTVPAAAATTSAPRLAQLTSALTITSGALPTTGAWVSGTAKVNPVTRQITVAVEVVSDGTANAATCAIAISPDNTTFSTIATPGASVAVNTVGAVTLLSCVTLPAGWFIKLTFAHATVASSVYY